MDFSYFSMITLDKQRSVRFNYYTLGQIEKETGKSFLNFDPESIGIGDSIIMAYYGCKCADPDFDLTIEQVGEHFKSKTFSELFEAFTNDMIRLNGEKK